MMCCDNQAAIRLSKNPVLHRRSKHIHINYHIVRAEVLKRHVQLTYINTLDNVADLMTKALGRVIHERLCKKILTRMVEGKVSNFAGGEPRVLRPGIVKERLYKTEPRGLTQ